MFVLFDMVIHRPSHQETETNLALLDTVAGYFSRFDYATTSSVPCSLFSGFAHIANQFVREQWHNTAPAALDAEVQNRTSGSQSRYFAYGGTYIVDWFILCNTLEKAVMDVLLTSRSSVIS